MSHKRSALLGWLIPGLAAVVVAVLLVAWQWPKLSGDRMQPPQPVQTAQNDSAGTILGIDSNTFGSQQSGGEIASSADHVRFTAVRDGDTLVARLRIDPGWHVNTNPASLDFLIPTKLWVQSQGKTLPLTVTYPKGSEINVGLKKPITVYSNQVQIRAALKHGMPAGTLHAALRVQACSDQGRCLMPSTLKVSVRSTSGA